MGVEVLGVANEGAGHGDTMDSFRNAEIQNSKILINLASGRKKNAVAPHYDPTHADHAWPKMLFHPGEGERTVGVTLFGIKDEDARDAQEKANKKAETQAKADGFRDEPYAKVQIAVLDPAAEKKALLDKNIELEGKLATLADQVAKMMAAGAPEKASKKGKEKE